MRLVRFAVGFAAGCVLGARAGRQRYDQITAAARQLSNHPVAERAQTAVKDLLSSAVEQGTHRLARDHASPVAAPTAPTAVEQAPRPPRRVFPAGSATADTTDVTTG
ncbi:hypothetical protein EEZ25_33230 [Micromonospora aurantiaca]|uniref:hypothetical protein n=1 Tax=Micromonospora aurantiaca (nom. illeg.) TaxID=47850 RepID=UPI000F414241|nr:hypothetical protein [Micromonospora aurantiaca]RNH93507.1 hypothetical protein EEZ25_33230 [Micromonospora aurantiaca]